MTAERTFSGQDRRFVSLFWRLFIPNLAVLLAAGIVLWVHPARGRVLALLAGVIIMALVNVVLMRHAFHPLAKLAEAMTRIDPLRPGQRVPEAGPESEVTVVTRAFNDMLDRLEDERRESARRELAAQERERQRIARELHDEIGQNLTALAMGLARAAEQAPPEQAERLLELRADTVTAVDDVRRVANSLRPEALDQLGLRAALTALCTKLTDHTGLDIEREFTGELPALTPATETAVYRIAQESLTNVVRHAAARRARLTLGVEDDGALVLRIADDGKGIPLDVSANGGIRGMRERAVLLGGELRMERAVGGGVAVVLRVPRPGAGDAR